MTTQITLGNFFTINGKNVLGGAGGSGLDTQSIITALTTIKSQPETNDQTQITANGKISSALTQFQTLLSSFQTAAKALSNPLGVGNEADNVFAFTTANVSASDGSTASNYLSVSSSPGAVTKSYTVNSIKQLATAANQSTGVLTATSADAAFAAVAGQIQPGTITPQQTLAVTSVESGAHGSSNITVSVNSVANLTVGQQITIAGIGGGTLDGISGLNGAQTITSIDTTNNTFTFAGTGTASLGNQSSTEGGGATAVNKALPSITINADDSLNAIAANFNAVSGQTGIGATVIQLSSGKYELSFTGTNTGTDSNFDLSSTAVDSGHTVFGGADLSSPTAAQNAEFYLNGISTPIVRQTNNISDVISGVTFNLTGAFNSSYDPLSPSGPSLNVAIQPDTTTVQNSIVGFVNAYNALQTFSTQQTQLNSDGTYASSAVLANNLTFRQTMSSINQEVTSQVDGLTGSVTSLADVGITLTTQPATSTTPQVNNILTVNDGQLSSALATNFQSIDNLFGLNMTSNNPNLVIYTETNALQASNFTLVANPIGGTFTAQVGDGPSINLTATALPGSSTGYLLSGPSGSVLDGLQLIYGSTNSATINVTVTQGIANTSYNTSNTATTANTGTIALALTGIQTSNTTLQQDITNVKTQVLQYQQQLLKQYAALESAISSTNNLLASLSANSAAQLESAQIG